MALRPIYGIKRPVQSGQTQVVSLAVGGLAQTVTGDTSLAATVATLGAATGALTVTCPLAVTSAGTSTVSPTLTNTAPGGVALAATVTVTSTVDAGLNLRSLAGTVTATSTVTHSVPPVVLPGGKFWLRDATVKVDNYDMTPVCRGVEVTFSRAELDITGFGDTYRTIIPGAPEATNFVVDLFSEPARMSAYGSRDPVWVEVTSRGPLPGVSNPQWAAYAVPERKIPLTGHVGDPATSPLELRSTGEIYEFHGSVVAAGAVAATSAVSADLTNHLPLGSTFVLGSNTILS